MSRYDGIKEALAKIDKGEGLVPTPDNIAEEMINMLPEELWKREDLHKVRFLNLYTKSGAFEVAIKKKLLSLDNFVNKHKDIEEVIHNMIYGIAPNEKCAEIARGELYDDCDYEGNIKVISRNTKEYIGLIKLDYKATKNNKLETVINNQLKLLTERIEELFRDKDGEKMKFDIVECNPPYNNDIYLDFVQLGHALVKKNETHTHSLVV